MKIQSKETAETIDYVNQQTSSKNILLDVESNHIRDKLRKKKQIAKQIPCKTKKQHINMETNKIKTIQSTKSMNSTKKKTSPKPIEKTTFNDFQSCQKIENSQQHLLNFFSNQHPQYFPERISSAKNLSKSSKKINESVSDFLAQKLLQQLEDQNDIKVTTLLQERQKLLFKSSKQQNLEDYEKFALNFMHSLKKQQKQNYNHGNSNKRSISNFQQQLQIILESKEAQCNNLFYLSTNDSLPHDNDLIKNLSKISFVEKEFLREMGLFQPVWQKEIQSKIIEQKQMKQLAKNLLVLAKCYKNNKNIVKLMLKKLHNAERNIYDVPQTTNNSNKQFYIKCMLKKCLIKSFSQSSTCFNSDSQLWNYFKISSHLQQNIINEGYRDNEKYASLNSEDEYKEYMKRIKNKKIIYKPTLHTSCKACFSNHFERYNPIVKCPQCKSRVHKFCSSNKMDDRCDKCNYKKLGANLKAQTPRCFICLNETNSLMLHKIKGSKYVHTFCMLVHNLWKITDEKLTFDANQIQQSESEDYAKSEGMVKSDETINSFSKSQRKSTKSSSIVIQSEEESQKKLQRMVDESEELCSSINKVERKHICKFCSKGQQISSKFLKNCKNCNQSFHILCAYLNGYQVQVSEWKNNFEMNLKINCCPSFSCSQNGQIFQQFEQKRQQRQTSRKYKLNYEKYALNFGFQHETKTTKQIPEIELLEQEQEQEQHHLDQKHEEKQTHKSTQDDLFDVIKCEDDEEEEFC